MEVPDLAVKEKKKKGQENTNYDHPKTHMQQFSRNYRSVLYFAPVTLSPSMPIQSIYSITFVNRRLYFWSHLLISYLSNI